MKIALLAALVAAAAVPALANDRYDWEVQNGNFTITGVTLSTDSGHFVPGETLFVSLSGATDKSIVAGTTRYEFYELFSPTKISQGSIDFFECTNKGCDPSKPQSLFLAHPSSLPTPLAVKFSTTVPPKTTSGHFTLVVWAEDQDHFPYAFSASIRFNLTNTEEAPEAAAAVEEAAPAAALRGSAPEDTWPPHPNPHHPRHHHWRPHHHGHGHAHHWRPHHHHHDHHHDHHHGHHHDHPHHHWHPHHGPSDDESLWDVVGAGVNGMVTQSPYTWTASNGNFSVSACQVWTKSGRFTPGAMVEINLRGVVPSKMLTAGTVKWQVYEDYVPSFVAQGFSPYFVCSNKGCSTDKPVALDLTTPDSRPSDFVLHMHFQVPEPKKTGRYRTVIWGEDQDHFPYDFSATVGFNATSSA